MYIHPFLIYVSKKASVKTLFCLCGIEKEKNNEDTVFKQVSNM